MDTSTRGPAHAAAGIQAREAPSSVILSVRGVQKANPQRLGAGERRGRGWEWPLREPRFPFAVKMCPETDRGGGCTKCHWITHLKTIKMMNFVLRSCITIKSLWCLCFEDLIFAQSKINCP